MIHSKYLRFGDFQRLSQKQFLAYPFLVFFLNLLTACGETQKVQRLSSSNDSSRAAVIAARAAAARAAEVAANTAPQEKQLDLSPTKLTLLPYPTRLAKLASITGLKQSDPVFLTLLSNKFELGESDFSKNIPADLSWSAQKMSKWVLSIRPVCQSQSVRAIYPLNPEGLDKFIFMAYGRKSLEEDRELLRNLVSNAKFSETERFENFCLTLLSSTEFVAQ